MTEPTSAERLRDTKVLADEVKLNIAERMKAGEDVPASELLAMHKLEIALQNGEAVERINDMTRGMRRGTNGAKAKASRAAKARG